MDDLKRLGGASQDLSATQKPISYPTAIELVIKGEESAADSIESVAFLFSQRLNFPLSLRFKPRLEAGYCPYLGQLSQAGGSPTLNDDRARPFWLPHPLHSLLNSHS
jgi:hypothetical protein